LDVLGCLQVFSLLGEWQLMELQVSTVKVNLKCQYGRPKGPNRYGHLSPSHVLAPGTPRDGDAECVFCTVTGAFTPLAFQVSPQWL
jgi:hypothetical protein